MDRKWLLFPCALVAGSAYLSTTLDSSFAFDRPLHTIGVLLALAGLAIVAHGTLTARKNRIGHKKRNSALPAPSSDSPDGSPSPSPIGRRITQSLLDPTYRAVLVVLLLFSICVRVAIYSRVMKDVECAGPSALAWLPFVLAVFHAAQTFRPTVSPTWRAELLPKALLAHILHFAFRGGSRYILPAFLLSLSGFLAALRATSLRSTYVCPVANGTASLIPRLQFAGFVFDCAAVILLYCLIDERASQIDETLADIRETTKSNVLVGLTFIAAAAGLVVTGIVVYTVFPEHRQWIVAAPTEYVRSLFSLSVMIPCTILCFLFTVRLHGVMSTVLMVGFSIAYTQVVRSLQVGVSYHFPPKPTTELTFYLILLTIACALYLIAESNPEGRSRPRIPFRLGRYQLFTLALVVFILSLSGFGYPSGWRRHPIMVHPITTLIDRANAEHDRWFAQAYQSKNLADAVKNYRKRYSRDPPPGFDSWYEYAATRGSIIIDDFDHIEEDLAPFSSLSPAELRRITIEVLSRENAGSQGLGGISIRNGKAEVFSNVPGTHRWMLDGSITMIEKFAEFLPDMDMAFNLNDECRVAVPFARLQKAHEDREIYPDHSTDEPTVGFSSDRASTWPDMASMADSTSVPSRFAGVGFNPTFQSHGSVACPPTSRARQERIWDTRSTCTSCTEPHSMGLFVSNWTLSASPCHQPDIANLHGLHLSPSALVGTHDLIPIFSQSKAPGFSDIRYPSAWNYVDKAVYAFNEQYPDPPFTSKKDVLFWRGATSEGVSAGSGAWKGMLRQRLVHLVNNETERQVILLPTGRRTLAYKLEEQGIIKYNLQTKLDVRFVGEIVRCGGQDCPDQDMEFGFGNSVDFQSHWRYRYLFDADGAGFSGRFLPFLQSNSVVFKSALVREWWDGRLKAWKHFVPVDLRLHDVWSIIAYFGGYALKNGGARTLEGETKKAERIARDSRVWVDKVMRKEDMEIYFFRLLLEWGRLTDDNRANVGFRMKDKGTGGGKITGQ